jgi:DNA polymerase-3 subunit alpha
VKLDELPLDDAPTYKILQDGDTIGVFQCESGGMRRMLSQLRHENAGRIWRITSKRPTGAYHSALA